MCLSVNNVSCILLVSQPKQAFGNTDKCLIIRNDISGIGNLRLRLRPSNATTQTDLMEQVWPPGILKETWSHQMVTKNKYQSARTHSWQLEAQLWSLTSCKVVAFVHETYQSHVKAVLIISTTYISFHRQMNCKTYAKYGCSIKSHKQSVGSF